ncbi:MAG: tyrosine-type recombinase/integrase [Thiomonas sp.]
MGKLARFRTRIRRGKNGQVWVCYYWDGTSQGRGEVSLGTDHAAAVRKWEELEGLRDTGAGTLKAAFDRFEQDILPTYRATTQADYRNSLKAMRPAMERATWEAVTTPMLAAYRDKRSAKTRANRELAVLGVVWKFAREWGYTALPYPGQGMRKNTEKPRRVDVTDAVFEAIYRHADAVLRDVMDWMTATGLRLTDVLALSLTDVRGDVLRVTASKTGKTADFVISESAVIPRLIERRMANKRAMHLRMLTTPTGAQVTQRMLRTRFDAARDKAAQQTPELADAIRATILRDMRKRAANLATDMAAASKLLGHSSQALTEKHYRTEGERIRPVR